MFEYSGGTPKAFCPITRIMTFALQRVAFGREDTFSLSMWKWKTTIKSLGNPTPKGYL